VLLRRQSRIDGIAVTIILCLQVLITHRIFSNSWICWLFSVNIVVSRIGTTWISFKRKWTQVLQQCMQFLLIKWHPSCWPCYTGNGSNLITRNPSFRNFFVSSNSISRKSWFSHEFCLERRISWDILYRYIMFGRGICEKYQSRDEQLSEPNGEGNLVSRLVFFFENAPPKHDMSV
jgi:hypothetical protein